MKCKALKEKSLHYAEMRMDMDFILKRGQRVRISLDERESAAVKIAAGNLMTDLGKVLNAKCALDTKDFASTGIVWKERLAQETEAGETEGRKAQENGKNENKKKVCQIRIATAKFLKEAVGEDGKADMAAAAVGMALQKPNGVLYKEGYTIQVHDGILYLSGSDRRGTIYAIYEFCEMLGVSPWYFWADVPVYQKEEYCLEEGFCKADYPVVEYRGIFINDEEELDHWVKLHMGEETIGVKTYEKVFELLLRLKANYIWPAMHVNSFNMKKENGALADRMGIVVGTSHCDMLMRSNNREWVPWTTQKGYTDAKYDYSIEGRNRDILKEYWGESVDQNKDFEVSYTLGMRGIHDSGFETENLQAGTAKERLQKKIELLELIIKDQEKLLADRLDEEPLKLFVPYKEVLELYDNGLLVPEDLTLIWSNDNYGYVRRYPSEEARKRKGGNGIYYHNSYWAPAGRSYLFISSIPLAQTKYELEKAYENGIQKLWVMNVGAMKPLEQEIEFYLRLAWETGKEEKGTTADVDVYLEGWINRNFSGNIGKETAKLLNDFTQIVNTRKVENMAEDIFSQTAYGDEGAGRLNALKLLYEEGNRIYETLPSEEKDAFFQMVLMKIHAAYYTNAMFYFADRSALCIKQGKQQAAALYTRLTREYDDLRRKMLHYYNEEMCRGKWRGILTPQDFPPPRTAMYPAAVPPLFMNGRSLLVTCFNDGNYLEFYKPGTKWIEVANGGMGSFLYEVTGEDWMELSVQRGKQVAPNVVRGMVSTEERILVKVTDCERDRSGRLFVKNLTDQTMVEVPVVVVSTGLHSTEEDPVMEDGVISVRADSQMEAGFRRIERLGRGGGALLEAYTQGARVSYPVFFTKEGDMILEVHRYPSLNSVGKIRIAVSVDDGEPCILESASNDEWRGQWAVNTMDHVDKLYLKLEGMKYGQHWIHFTAVDRYFAFSRFVIYSGSVQQNSLGVVNGDQTLPGIGALQKEETIWYGSFRLAPQPEYIAQWELEGSTLSDLDRIRTREAYAKPVSPLQILLQGRKPYQEKNGAFSIDAFAAYGQTSNAFTTHCPWDYCVSESYGRSGLCMHIRQKGLTWQEEKDAPALHYILQFKEEKEYTIWVLSKVTSDKDAGFRMDVDGKALDREMLYRRGSLWKYEAEQIWRWTPAAKVVLSGGLHEITFKVLSSGTRIDRFYITAGSEVPPTDAEWQA